MLKNNPKFTLLATSVTVALVYTLCSSFLPPVPQPPAPELDSSLSPLMTSSHLFLLAPAFFTSVFGCGAVGSIKARKLFSRRIRFVPGDALSEKGKNYLGNHYQLYRRESQLTAPQRTANFWNVGNHRQITSTDVLSILQDNLFIPPSESNNIGLPTFRNWLKGVLGVEEADLSTSFSFLCALYDGGFN